LIVIKASPPQTGILNPHFHGSEPPMRLTTRTSLALRTLMFCAVNNDRIVRKFEVAERCNVSENHLAQVINGLAHAGFLTTLRGRKGGLMLARPMGQIGVGAVARAFEGQVPLAECFTETRNTCPLAPACRLRRALADAVEAFYASLDRLTIADLVVENEGLAAILEIPAMPDMRRNCAGRAHAL
jgi:Rrf2 family nitric oxide-sensitive transcriptional repressor